MKTHVLIASEQVILLKLRQRFGA